MGQEWKLRDEVETVMEFTYLGDRLSAGGGCEAAVTARTRCGWVMSWECCGCAKDENGCLLELHNASNTVWN